MPGKLWHVSGSTVALTQLDTSERVMRIDGTNETNKFAATINSLMQSQMMLTAKIDALANSVKMNESEGRMRMYLAAAGGAAAAMLALRLFDSQR